MAEADAEIILEGLQGVPTSAAFILATICLMVMAPIIIITGSYRSSEKTNNTKTIFSHVPRLNITTRLATLFTIFKVMGLIHTVVGNSFMTVLISVSLAAFLIRFCSHFEFGNLLAQFVFHCFQPLFDAYHNGYHQNGVIKNSLFQLSLTRISRHSSNYRRAPSVLVDFTFSKLQLCLLTIVFMDRLSMILEWRHGLLLFFIECIIFIVPIVFMAPAVSFITRKLFPDAFPSARRYHLQIRHAERRSEHHHHKIIIDCTMDKVCKEVLAVTLCVAVAVWNIEATNQNWISKNMIGMASMATCIELLHLKSIYPGCILLGTVITEEVIQVLLIATTPRLLGILDILIPGFFMAFLLRFDRSLDRNSYVYFYSSFCAYIAGLMITAITVFMYQQPTILYSLPYCVLVPVLVAYVKSDLSLMFRFRSEANAESDRQCNGMEDNTAVKDQ